MEFETADREYGVEEFYHQFKNQLPKIVMVNQGFYDDLGDDTFSREQILRLHTTRRYQRALVRSYVGKVKKTYSMSINYPKKFCFVDEVGYEQSLYAIIRDRTLPVKVRLSNNQRVMVNGEKVSARKIPEMELIETFTEICFLGTDIDKTGLMSPGVVKLTLCLDKMTLKIVTGISGMSKKGWKEYTRQWNNESKSVAFDVEQGTEDLAHYNEDQVQKNTDISKLEPVLYTNLSILVNRKSAITEVTSESLPTIDDDNVYECVGQVQHPKTGENPTQACKPNVDKPGAIEEKTTGLMQELTAAMKRAKKNIGKIRTPQSQHQTSPIAQGKEKVAETKLKPAVAPKPNCKGKARKSNYSQVTMQNHRDLSSETISTRDKEYIKGYYTYDESQTTQEEFEPKVYDLELDYDTAKERKLDYDTDAGHVEVYSRASVCETERKADGKYINTDSMAIVTPMSHQDTMYANCTEIRQSRTQRRNIDISTSQLLASRKSTRLRLSQEEIHDLSINELGEFLRKLKLDSAVETFRENQIDGKLLTELTDDILKTDFQLKPLQVVKLKTFIREGHIPQ